MGSTSQWQAWEGPGTLVGHFACLFLFLPVVGYGGDMMLTYLRQGGLGAAWVDLGEAKLSWSLALSAQLQSPSSRVCFALCQAPGLRKSGS